MTFVAHKLLKDRCIAKRLEPSNLQCYTYNQLPVHLGVVNLFVIVGTSDFQILQEETKCLRAVEEKPVYMDIHHGRRNAKYERRRLLADELNHLNNTQGWEFKGGYQ